MEKISIKELVAQTSLETRLKVANQMAFQELLVEIGFRERKPWADDEDELLKIIWGSSKDLAKWQLEEIKQWELDGKP